MRIAQVVPALTLGDAVSNNCRAIDAILHEAGYDTKIYAENYSPNMPKGLLEPLGNLRRLGDRDILLYHMAISLERNMVAYGGQRIFQYHNITPPEFYREYNPQVADICEAGLSQMRSYKDAPMLCWADSEFNRQDLINAGYSCCIHTVPILVPFQDYEKPADQKVLEQYDDDYVNFLFVGRVVPNKAHEDVIRTFAWYQKHVNPKCRLFLVGNADMKSYVGRLKRYIALLKVQNVIFPGHISFNAILAYYKLADVFLCMSLHEGFCVPLLEAMYFHVPIIARATTAIPYTLNGSGVLLEDNDPVTAALMVDRIVRDPALKAQIIEKQDRRLEDFSHERIKKQILEELKAFA